MELSELSCQFGFSFSIAPFILNNKGSFNIYLTYFAFIKTVAMDKDLGCLPTERKRKSDKSEPCV